MDNTGSDFYKTSNTFYTTENNTRPTTTANYLTTNNDVMFGSTDTYFHTTNVKPKFKSMNNNFRSEKSSNKKIEKVKLNSNNMLTNFTDDNNDNEILKTYYYPNDTFRSGKKASINQNKFHKADEVILKNDDYTIRPDQAERDDIQVIRDRDEKELKRLDAWELQHNINSKNQT